MLPKGFNRHFLLDDDDTDNDVVDDNDNYDDKDDDDDNGNDDCNDDDDDDDYAPKRFQSPHLYIILFDVKHTNITLVKKLQWSRMLKMVKNSAMVDHEYFLNQMFKW